MSARILQGVVVSDKMDKTVVVTVARRKQHPLYRKVINRSKRFKAHDAANECNIGDVVRILETSPISKDKSWRVIEILERGDVAEVSPRGHRAQHRGGSPGFSHRCRRCRGRSRGAR